MQSAAAVSLQEIPHSGVTTKSSSAAATSPTWPTDKDCSAAAAAAAAVVAANLTTTGSVANESPKAPVVREGVGVYEPKEEYNALHDNLNDEATLPPPLQTFDSPAYFLQPLDALPPECNILDYDVTLLHKANHADPFGVLGPRLVKTNSHGTVLLVRAWVKDSLEIQIAVVPKTQYSIGNDNAFVPMHKRCDWLFQRAFAITTKNGASAVPDIGGNDPVFYELKVGYTGGNEFVIRDTYNTVLLASEYDLKLFQSGSCWHIDNLMGSHIVSVNGAEGVRFVVWAPNAVFMSVVGEWNAWDGRAHPMRKRHEYGVWELLIPGVRIGMKYGYRIHSPIGTDFIKIDPYAQEFENPPATASVISGCDDAYKLPSERFQWTDGEWMKSRTALGQSDELRRQPMAIYEVHLPSWRRGDGNSYLGYREMADRLVNHCKNMKFTHVEFLPLAHHPFEGSWGYQISGQFAPYSRLGNADDLKFLINKLHEANIGVFIDYVPAHFCKDEWGLVHYDGVPCYEYADPREGEHKKWGTMVFNFRRNEVRSFLLGAAYHWLRRYHIDGLRIDAVSSMLYKNHFREEGAWIPNEFGGDANLEAISLLQELNWVIHKEFPGVFTMAEESTSWQGVTDKEKGLGFDAKWDLGWMNDTLSYLCLPTTMRPAKHNKLTFRGLYVAHESWVLPLSHDEVVSGKGSLLDKCGFKGASFEERVKTLRTLFGFQVGMPGRPLIFMGCEFGQGREWREKRSVDWHEAQEDVRSKVCLWTSDLLAVYQYHVALHRGDDESWNFQWIDCDNAKDSIVAWLRKWADWFNDILVICNFSGEAYRRYPIGCPHGGEWEILLNSDDWRYGGAMHGPGNLTKIHTTQGGRIGWPYCLWVDIPAFGCLFLKAPQPPQAQLTDVGAADTKGSEQP